MTLTEKHAAMILELGELKINFQALAARLGSCAAAQRSVDEIGVKLIALEHSSGIADARALLAHETVLSDLPMFEEMVAEYSAPVDWPGKIAAGTIAAEDVESKMAERAHIVSEAKKSVASLTRMRNEANQRRKKFSAEVLAIAGERSPISGYERENWERLYIYTNTVPTTNGILEKIFKPRDKELASV